jgi:hypothetical protein
MCVVVGDRRPGFMLKNLEALVSKLGSSELGIAQGFLAYSVDFASYFVVCREASRELRCFALTLLRFWGRTTLKLVIVPSKTNG